MPKVSAGLLVYRRDDDGDVEVLLVHPGGPLWKKKDEGAWSDREFAEELGSPAPAGVRLDLGQITQRSGKLVRAWAVAGDLDVDSVRSNNFDMEWPRGSGQIRSFPEVDKAAWFTPEVARSKLVEAQTAFLDRLALALADGAGRT
jgi:predicted NUDIX family NTP pyrophosphohydrolase